MALLQNKTLCVIGDSQMACAARGLKEGLTQAPPGWDVEFWGAEGPLFRAMDFKDGAMRMTKADATARVIEINEQQRDHIAPGDFDALLFFGARLRVAAFFADYFQWQSTRVSEPTRAVLEAAIHDFCICTRAYRIARAFAEQGDAVFFAPDPFMTAGILDYFGPDGVYADQLAAQTATAQQRAALWDGFERVAAQDGIKLLAQDDETVQDGILTKPEFAIAGAEAVGDHAHKSPAFGALRLQQVWQELPPVRSAA
ncbi:MAG: hypothetical protein AAFN94_16335 [Pseudomonadota bacterium]